MKLVLTIAMLACFLTSNVVTAQKVCNEFYYKAFSKKELNEDLDFIVQRIQHAHANPYFIITKQTFEQNIANIRASLKDSLTQRDFYFKVQSIFVNLNDEHSALMDFCITDSIKKKFKVFPLRFQLQQNKILLTEDYSDQNLAIDDEVVSINNIPAGALMDSCSKMEFGISDERRIKAVEDLWLMLAKFCYFITDNYHVKFASGRDAIVKSLSWSEFNKKYKREKPTSNEKIKYERFDKTGYLAVNTFNVDETDTKAVWQQRIDSVFTLIKRDAVNTLFIDVSNNTGGNSIIGDILISYFSDKPYKDYSGKWRKSQEYADRLVRWKMRDEAYERIPDGEVMLIGGDTTFPAGNKNRFTGKTYVVIGKNTFSSAIMFGTIIADNKLATLIGTTPDKGHPNHFGEIIDFETPHTQLRFVFGVKEWIRPSGKTSNNKLIPDLPVTLTGKTPQEIIAAVQQ